MAVTWYPEEPVPLTTMEAAVVVAGFALVMLTDCGFTTTVAVAVEEAPILSVMTAFTV